MRGESQIGFQKPFEFQKRLVVKSDEIDIGQRDAGFIQTVMDGTFRKTVIVFFPGEALFLGCSDNNAVFDQCSGAVMVKGGNAKNALCRSASENGVDEGCDSGAVTENQQAAKNRHHDQDGQQPEFLPCPEKMPKLCNKGHCCSLELSFHGFRFRPRRVPFDPVRFRLGIERAIERIFAAKFHQQACRHHCAVVQEGHHHRINNLVQ